MEITWAESFELLKKRNYIYISILKNGLFLQHVLKLLKDTPQHKKDGAKKMQVKIFRRKRLQNWGVAKEISCYAEGLRRKPAALCEERWKTRERTPQGTHVEWMLTWLSIWKNHHCVFIHLLMCSKSISMWYINGNLSKQKGNY